MNKNLDNTKAIRDTNRAFLAINAIPNKAKIANLTLINFTNPKIGNKDFKIFFLPRASTTNERTDALTSSGIAFDKLRAAVAISKLSDLSCTKFFVRSMK